MTDLCRKWKFKGKQNVTKFVALFHVSGYVDHCKAIKKNPAKRRYVTSVSLFIHILVWGMAKSLSWAVTKYCVGVGWAMTKYKVGVGWAVTKYRVGIGLAVTKYRVGLLTLQHGLPGPLVI